MEEVKKPRIAIIHPWLPQYRVEFFTLLSEKLDKQGVELKIYFGSPESDWAKRNDQSNLPGSTMLRTKQLRLFGRVLLSKRISGVDWSQFDLIVVEQAVRNLETYKLLAKQETLAFWGHGKTYTQKQGLLLEKLKVKLTLKGQWFFVYTQGGKVALVNNGFQSRKISVLNNTFDAKKLRLQLESLSTEEVATFRKLHNLKLGSTGIFIGALDAVKRLDLLFEAVDFVHSRNPDFRLIIAGAGPLLEAIQRETEIRPWVTYFEPAFGRDKALLLAASDIICIPGRVGLVTIDSFAARKPIVTSPDPFHPPEIEYLVNGRNAIISENLTPESYGLAILKSLERGTYLNLVEGCGISHENYTLDSMVESFVDGVTRCLEEIGPKRL
ncbi:MAG: glycosyltransferase [Micrococcales bacterium]|nr:glycosyltransferase [Micrococcales bacterium]NBR61441.1 glycosyltransferase [Actinomycetota bacterium]